MLTFYIVQFCFVCFVVMPPRLGSILIALSFLVLYLSLYFADGAVGIQPQNYALFGLIAVFGNAFQYMRVRETEKRRVHILELNQILRQEASIDDLTKLKNRNALRNDFDRYTGRYIYAIMADIDHFKSYNDAYGHVVGDEVLGRVAAATKEAFSNGDAYRYGGDEFLIILADRTEEEFNGSIASWREAVRSVQAPGISHPITCSFGYIRCFIKNADDLRDAIKAADDHLYEVKKAKLAMSPTL